MTPELTAVTTKGNSRNFLIVTGIFPPDIGGPATYVPQIASFLSQRGHAVTVVTLSESEKHESDCDYPFQLIRIRRKLAKPLRYLQTAYHIFCIGSQSHLLFINGLQLEATLINLLLRRPMVHKVVGDLAWERATGRGWVNDSFEVFQGRRYTLKIELMRRLRSWWTCRADCVIVPSRYLARIVQQWGVAAERSTVIYNGIESPPPATLPIL